jgi:hypothetical protein
MASRVGEIKAAIKTLIDGVTGVDSDQVYTHFRHVIGGNDADFETLFKTSGDVIHVWQIERANAGAEWAAQNVAWHTTDTFQIRGLYGFKDGASESAVTFQEVVEGIVEAINASQDLGASLTGSSAVIRHDPVQVRSYTFQAFGGRLCHLAELVVVVHWMHQP